MPTLAEIKAFCKTEIESLWSEIKRFENPHKYYVDLSKNLWQLKQDLLNSHGRNK